MANVVDILSRVRISEVYSALTGAKPKRLPGDAWLGPAVWRGGDGFNVSLRDERGVWYDYVTGEGGGLIDLVVRIRGGSREDALKWIAALAGVELEDHQMPAEDLQKWKEEKAMVERNLPSARLWQRIMVAFTDELLTSLKASLFDPSLPRPEVGEIYNTEQFLKQLERLEGIELINEFQRWKNRHPGLTEALVREAGRRERAEERALYRFIRALEVPGGRQSESRH